MGGCICLQWKECGLRLLSAWSVDPDSGLRDFWRVFVCVAQEIPWRKRAKERKRERKKKPRISHKRKPNTSLLCCLGSRRLFIGILWQRVPVRRHFTGPGKMRRISAFALCACLFLQSVFSFFCLNQYQCKRLRRLITATRSAHFALTGDRGRMINALHCGMVRWRVNND